MLVICAALAVLYWAQAFFITLIAAVVIAFILEPFVALLMRLRLPRSLASFVICSLALLVVYLLGLGVYSQMSVLVDDLPTYSRRIGEVLEAARDRVEGMERATYRLIVPRRQQEKQQEVLEQAKTKKKTRGRPAEPVLPLEPTIQEVRIHSESPMLAYFYSRLGSLYQMLLMASFVPFLVYFMLSWRDHIHRSFLQFFESEDRVVAAKSLQGIADMVRGFVVGNFVLGLLLAATSSLAFWKLGLPFPLLVGPLSGFLSLVPYIGLPVAMIPPIFVALAVHSDLSAYLLLGATVTLLHVVALNLFYPKIVGSRVHLNPLVVTVALMLWGFLWNAPGLVLAIPLTAALKAVCDNVRGLRHYGKFLGD
ncbi:MAG: AI-2E family transporter [Bryobacteraceae bacterium]